MGMEEGDRRASTAREINKNEENVLAGYRVWKKKSITLERIEYRRLA